MQGEIPLYNLQDAAKNSHHNRKLVYQCMAFFPKHDECFSKEKKKSTKETYYGVAMEAEVEFFQK